MNIGMLWFDNSKATLKDKIKGAVEYYTKKYGKAPNLCYVHPHMLQNEQPAELGIEVRGNRSVKPNHFWIGTKREGE